MNWSVGVAIRRQSLLDFRRGNSGAVVVATTSSRRVKEDGDGCGVRRRRAALRMVDRQLTRGNFKLALSLVKQLQRQPPSAGLRGFAAARQVPRKISSVEELNLSVTETSELQSLLDSILGSIMSSLQSSPSEERELDIKKARLRELDNKKVSLFKLENSVTGEDIDLYLENDIIERGQVVLHEAGHFLVGYLLGVLPKKYRFSNVEDVKQDKIPDASVKFIGFDFLTEIEDVTPSKKKLYEVKPGNQANRRKLSSTVLSRFLCVIVGGLVAEHLAFGNSKGHHADVEKLDRVLKWLPVPEDEANTLIRWAVLNTLLILRRHGEATSKLVEAMAHGRSIGNCIDMIESALNHKDI